MSQKKKKKSLVEELQVSILVRHYHVSKKKKKRFSGGIRNRGPFTRVAVFYKSDINVTI